MELLWFILQWARPDMFEDGSFPESYLIVFVATRCWKVPPFRRAGRHSPWPAKPRLIQLCSNFIARKKQKNLTQSRSRSFWPLSSGKNSNGRGDVHLKMVQVKSRFRAWLAYSVPSSLDRVRVEYLHSEGWYGAVRELQLDGFTAYEPTRPAEVALAQARAYLPASCFGFQGLGFRVWGIVFGGYVWTPQSEWPSPRLAPILLLVDLGFSILPSSFGSLDIGCRRVFQELRCRFSCWFSRLQDHSSFGMAT